MTRPQMIRADTIDLQTNEPLSPKKHKAPTKAAAPNGNGSLAPHQAETLREVQEDRAGEEARSPRVSWVDGDNGSDLQQYAEDLANGIANSLNGNKMPSEDALAIAQNGGVTGSASEDGDMDADADDLDDDMMDKISSSPSIEDDSEAKSSSTSRDSTESPSPQPTTQHASKAPAETSLRHHLLPEDIDFEFVYALHTFVATVEGQANATKGDTMVLLDDSNSYWWLVRVVKDSSIGYLPAEHIETPTERLARLNKHRNIDLSATMLGDTAEKTKSSIKTAMKRRKAKTVTFTAPTYVDYSDFDFSSDEEDGDVEKQSQQQGAQQGQQQQAQQKVSQQAAEEDAEDDESAKVEPLKPRGLQKQVKMESANVEDANNKDSAAAADLRRDSNEMFDGKTERVTRNGTVRNTDSFFKDETIETKKITLTPGLLRDDNEARISSDSKDSSLRQRPSFEKELTPDKKDEKKKKDKDKKEKEKKPSAIRSFFSRKDRKKSVDDDDDSFGKRSMDASTEITEKEAEEPQAVDLDSSPDKTAPQRNPSKLQKNPRTDPSPTRKPATAPSQAGVERGPMLASETRTNNVANVPPATLRMVESDQLDSQDRAQKNEKANSKSAAKEAKPQKVTKAKSRVELDDFDSPEEEDIIPEPTRAPPEPKPMPSEEKQLRPTLPGAYPDSYISTQTSVSEMSDQTVKGQSERLSESPVQVSPVMSSNPPALLLDSSSQEDRSSPISSPSPELVDMDGRTHGKQDSVATSTSATTTSTWNDNNLRAFFDSGSDIRDLLVIVYDKNDVAPAGPEHPVVGTLFREQNARLAEITTQLDNMLGDWLARKQRLRGTV